MTEPYDLDALLARAREIGADGLVRALLGCEYGHTITTNADDPPCEAGADQIVIGHLDGQAIGYKLCRHHTEVVIADTEPHQFDSVARVTGTPREEPPPEEAPVCPGCGAVGVLAAQPLPAALWGEATGGVVAWHWVTQHDTGCTWMADPDAEPY